MMWLTNLDDLTHWPWWSDSQYWLKWFPDLGKVEDVSAVIVAIVEVLHFVVPYLDGFVPGCVVPSQVLTHGDTETCEALQWRYNEPNGVSNHQSHDCLLNRYSGADQRKYQSLASLAFVRGIHRWWWIPVIKRASNAKNASIWWRLHVKERKAKWDIIDRMVSIYCTGRELRSGVKCIVVTLVTGSLWLVRRYRWG